jgi:hypothetical protein
MTEPIVSAMRAWVALALASAAVVIIGSQTVGACGDKFLLVGRGVRFQRAYAAIHPGSILIVMPPKSVKNAAVRDSRLQSALKMAGHRVDLVTQAGAADQVARSRYDLILAERTDALVIRDLVSASPGKPSVVGVLEDPSAAEFADASQRLQAVIKTPQSVFDILKTLDDVMKGRLDNSRRPTAAGG